MPLTGAGVSGVKIDFEGDASKFIAASNSVIAELAKNKAAVKAAGKEIEASAKAQAKAIADAAKSQKGSFTEISSAIGLVKQAFGVLKAGFDFAKEGAQIQFLQGKFENLAESIGTTSEALLGELKGATGGIYSDMQLMASATDFVGLGLANTSDEAVRLAKVSGGLNMNMNQLVLTLTNMTTMRFDALGVRVDGFKEKVEALKATGMDADAAFKEAFLQQAEAQLLLVGNAADTTAGQFMILEANVANTGDTLKQVAATSFAPIVKYLNDQSAASLSTRDAVAQYNEKMLETGGTLILNRATYNVLKDKVFEYAKALDVAAASEAHIARDDVATGLNNIGVAAEATAEELKATSDAYTEQWGVIQKVQQETDKFTESNEKLNEKLAELEEKQKGQGKWTQGYKDTAKDIENVKGEITDLAAKHEEASKKMIFDMMMMGAAADGWQEGEFEAAMLVAQSMGIVDAATVKTATNFIKQSDAMTAALQPPLAGVSALADMWMDLANLSKTGIVLTASVVKAMTGGAMGGASGDGTCFTGDTLISMADGTSKPIRDIVIGDEVLSFDLEKKQQIKTIVVETFEHPATEGGRLLLFNGRLKVTEEHLLWDGFVWKAAGLFQIGDVLMNIDGSLDAVRSVRELVKNELTYNFHVDNENHNYFAGGILAHNAKSGTSNAGGGRLSSGWTLVGDRPGGGFIPGASELIYNGMVFSSKVSKKLIDSGVVGNFASRALPDEDFGTSSTPPTPSAPNLTTNSPVKNSGVGGSVGGSSGSSQSISIEALVSSVNETQTQTQTVAQMLQAQYENTAARIEKSNKAVQNKFDELIGVMLSGNPRAIGSQVGFELAKRT